MEQKIWLSSEFRVSVCTQCGTVYAVLQQYINERRDDHKTFYCPNGHGQHFPQMSDEEKLQEQLKHCQADRDFWQDGHDIAVKRQAALKRSRSSLRGVITRMKKVKQSNGQEVLAKG